MAGNTAGEVRAEDAFDVVAVDAWLRAERPDLDLGTGLPAVRQFAGGASNLTYQLDYPRRSLILRRPPVGAKAKSAHDMHREFDVQQRLAAAFPYVPEMIAFCGDESVLGSDFYVMSRLEGDILRSRIPESLGLTPENTRALCESAVDRLADLHSVDLASAGLDAYARGDGYVARQIAGWADRYRRARTENVPDFAEVIAWLEENAPADVAQVLIHNDYRLDNLVLRVPEAGGTPEIVGVLDWEMATVGDPLMDLGAALAYWVQADDDEGMQGMKRQPTDAPGMLTREEVVRRYAERTGRDVRDWLFYEVYGLFRLAGIVQQIYYRYHHGQTTNPAFEHFWVAVAYLDHRCRTLITVEG